MIADSQVMYTEERRSERVPNLPTGTPSCQTDLGSNLAEVGTPHPSPTLSPSPPQPGLLLQPHLFLAVGYTSATPRRQETDGGVRLAGGNLNAGSTSGDSLATLPPAYQPHY